MRYTGLAAPSSAGRWAAAAAAVDDEFVCWRERFNSIVSRRLARHSTALGKRTQASMENDG